MIGRLRWRCDAFDPPPQLRCTTGLDGIAVRVSGFGDDRMDRGKLKLALMGSALLGGGLYALFGSDEPVLRGVVLVALVAAMAWFDARSESDPHRDAVLSRVRLGPTHLVVELPGHPAREVLWRRVGRARVRGTVHPVLEVLVLDEPPVEIRMQYEPMEHAAWLADAVQSTARERRRAAGSEADVPRPLERLRR